MRFTKSFKKKAIVLIVLLTNANNALAQVYSGVVQSRSMGMGGAGVAVADVANGPSLNPAALSALRSVEQITVTLPAMYVGVADLDDLTKEVTDFQDKDLVNRFELGINNTQSIEDYQNVLEIGRQLSQELSGLAGKSLSLDGGVYAGVSKANSKFGFGLSVTSGGDAHVIMNYRDADLLSRVMSEVGEFTECLSALENGQFNCDLYNREFQFVDVANGQVNFSPRQELRSDVVVQGMLVTDVALSLSSSIKVKGGHVAFGVSPKIQSISVFDYLANVDSAEFDGFETDQYLTQHDVANLDMGVLVQPNDKLAVGLTIKNVFDAEVVARRGGVQTGNTFKVQTQARIGAAYTRNWYTLAIDMDLSPLKHLNGKEVQMMGLGAEINGWSLAQLRFGYQFDMNNAESGLVTAGLGFSPFGAFLDIGLSGNDRQISGGAQLGFRW